VLASLSDSVTVNGMLLGQLRTGLQTTQAEVPENMMLVSKTELDAAEAMTLEISDGMAVLGISVCTNSNLSAPVSTWGTVSFEKSGLQISADGKRILAPIPANADRGFMVLRSHPRDAD